MRSPVVFLREVTSTRESQTIRVFLMSCYLLLIITCYTTTKAVRDSVFITGIGTSPLPYLYMLTAAGMAILSAVYARALRSLGLFALVRLTSFVAIVGLIAFWWLIVRRYPASFYFLYVSVSLFGAITASQAWSVAAQVFDAREARRSYTWIGLGGVLGGIAGGGLAKFVAPWAGTDTLLLICAGLMLVTVVILDGITHFAASDMALQKPKAQDPELTTRAVVSRVKDSPYLSRLVVLLMAAVIVEAFIDYEFKVVSNDSFNSRDSLTSFFGSIASYGGILALIIQTLITSRLLKTFGVGVAVLLLPSALLVGFIVLAVQPALWAVSILKLIDVSLSYSVHRSATELLYIPIPADFRASVKALIDMLVDRAGRALGGLFLILLTVGLSFSISALSVVACVCLVVWGGTALLIRRNYIQAFRVALEKKVIEPEALEVNTLDNSMIRSLLTALSSEDTRRVLYALDVLGSAHPARWQSYLPILLEHPSPPVRARTLALLTKWKVDSTVLVSAKLEDPDLDVRIEAVRHLCQLVSADSAAKLKEFLTHNDYAVVLAAIHGIAKYALPGKRLIDDELLRKALMTEGTHRVTARTAAAGALRVTGIAGRTQFLEDLLHDPSVEVLQEAIRTAAAVRYEAAIPLLVSMLARRGLRTEAREALVALMPASMGELQSRFSDERTPTELRARIAKVLSFVPTQEVADFLAAAIDPFQRSLGMSLLKALNRIRAHAPDIRFEREQIEAFVVEECERYRQLATVRRTLRSCGNGTAGSATEALRSLLDRAIAERLAESLEKVFRLMALIYPPADIHAAYFNVTVRPALRPSAIEFLDNLIDAPLRVVVMPIIEDCEQEPTRDGEDNSLLSRQQTTEILLQEEDEWVRTITRELLARGGFEEGVSSKIA